MHDGVSAFRHMPQKFALPPSRMFANDGAVILTLFANVLGLSATCLQSSALAQINCE